MAYYKPCRRKIIDQKNKRYSSLKVKGSKIEFVTLSEIIVNRIIREGEAIRIVYQQ